MPQWFHAASMQLPKSPVFGGSSDNEPHLPPLVALGVPADAGQALELKPPRLHGRRNSTSLDAPVAKTGSCQTRGWFWAGPLENVLGELNA